jgi:hypothetical protein|tara:strand:- start:6862 stop:7092 length:231 start_codon:yes stop_codon:yes gene_type:complete
MKVGDIVRFRTEQRYYHGEYENLPPNQRTIGIITEQYPPPDEVLFVMMGDRGISGIEFMVVREDDMEVINETSMEI